MAGSPVNAKAKAAANGKAAAAGPSAAAAAQQQRIEELELTVASLTQELSVVRAVSAAGDKGGALGTLGQQVDALRAQLKELATLRADKTALEAEMARFKTSCVVVSDSDYQDLQMVYGEKVFFEKELAAVRLEHEEALHKVAGLEEHIRHLQRDCVSIPTAEYESLLSQKDERMALELRLESVEKHCALVPKAELSRLRALKVEEPLLREQISRLTDVANGKLSKDGARQRILELEAQVTGLISQVALAQVERERLGGVGFTGGDAGDATTTTGAGAASGGANGMASGQSLTESGGGGSGMGVPALGAGLTGLQARTRIGDLELALSVAQTDKARAEARCSALDMELNNMKAQVHSLTLERERLTLEAKAAREASGRDKAALTEATSRRIDNDHSLQALKSENQVLTAELIAAKVEVARLQEMEALFRREVYVAKKKMYGLPAAGGPNEDGPAAAGDDDGAAAADGANS